MKKLALVAAAVAVLAAGVLIGYLASDRDVPDVTGSSEYQALRSRYEQATTDLSDTEQELSGLQSINTSLRNKYTAITDQIDEIEAGLQEDRDTILAVKDRLLRRIDALVRREAGLDDREAGLDAREDQLRREEVVAAKSRFPGDGTFIVGQDVIAGTYRSAGARGCYYAFLSGVGSDADIIDNNLTDGPTIVSLAAGQVFETSGCAEWVKQ